MTDHQPFQPHPSRFLPRLPGMQEALSLGDAAKRLLTVTCDACVSRAAATAADGWPMLCLGGPMI